MSGETRPGTNPGTCQFCGRDYKHSLAKHLRNGCDAI